MYKALLGAIRTGHLLLLFPFLFSSKLLAYAVCGAEPVGEATSNFHRGQHLHPQRQLSDSSIALGSGALVFHFVTCVNFRRGHYPSPMWHPPLNPFSVRLHRLLLHHSSCALCRFQWTCPNHSRMLLGYVNKRTCTKSSYLLEGANHTSNNGSVGMPTSIPDARLPCVTVPSSLGFVMTSAQIRITGPRMVCRLIYVDFTC